MLTKTGCPTPDALERYALGRYSDEEGNTVERHLADCSSCEESLAELEHVSDSLVRHLPLTAKSSRDSSPSVPWIERLKAGPLAVQANFATVESAAAEEQHPSDQVLGSYRLTGIVGRGGMGIVYSAVHKQLGRNVAIKIVDPRLVSAMAAQARFDREISLLGALDHPGIVQAIDAGRVSGAAYLVMEKVDGADLARFVRQTGPLKTNEACEIGRQIAEALAAAHQAGAVHRDIKPSNVMIDREGNVKLLDFGLAIPGPLVDADTSHQTSVGQLIGTLDYMAPEQASGDEVGPAADIYGLGATLFFLLTGRQPRDHSDQASLIQKLRRTAEEPADSLADHRTDAPTELVELLASLLALEPSNRPESMDHVADRLATFCEENADQRLKQIAIDLPPASSDHSAKEIDRSLSLLLGNETENQINLAPIAESSGGGSSYWGKVFAIAGGAAFFGLLWGLTVLVLRTPEGTVRIESELSGVTLNFVDKQDRVTGIAIEKGDNSAELRTGRYIVRFRDPQVGFVISPNDFRVDDTRDITVRVHRLPQYETADAAIDVVDQHETHASHSPASFANASEFLDHARREMNETEILEEKLQLANDYLSGKRGDGMAGLGKNDKTIASLEIFADLCVLLYRGRPNFEKENAWDCFQEIRSHDVHHWRGIGHDTIYPKRSYFEFVQRMAEYHLREYLGQSEPASLDSLVAAAKSDVRVAAILAILCRQAKTLENRSSHPHPFPTIDPHQPEDSLRWKIQALASVIMLGESSKENGNHRKAARAATESLADLLCRRIDKPLDEQDGQIAAELLSASTSLGASSQAYSQLIMARLTSHTESSDVQGLLRLRMTPNELSTNIYFKREFIDNHRNAIGYYCDGWPSVTHHVLMSLVAEDPITELERKLVQSLEVIIPLVQADDANADRLREDLRRNSDALKTRLRRYYVAKDQPSKNVHWKEVLPVAPERMLTLIAWIDGAIPDFVSNGLPISSGARERIRLLQDVVDNLDDDYNVYERHRDQIRDVMSIAPFQTIKTLLEADEFKKANLTLAQALQTTTKRPDERLEGNRTYQAVDVFLLLGVYRELIQVSPSSSDNFRHLLLDAGVAALSEPLRNVLDSQAFVRQTLLDQFVALTRQATEQQTRDAILDFDSRIADAVTASTAENADPKVHDDSGPSSKASSMVDVFVDEAGKPGFTSDGPRLSTDELTKQLATRNPTPQSIRVVADAEANLQSVLLIQRALLAEPKLSGADTQFQVAATNEELADEFKSDGGAQLPTGSHGPPTLYAGKTEPQWQTIFDAERNPIAKIEAGKALVMLTDTLTAPERIDRVLEIAGALIQDGWGGDPDEYLLDYLSGRVSRAKRMRWPNGFSELSDAWFHFDQLCESRIGDLPSEILCKRLLAKIISSPRGPEAVMAASLLYDLSIRRRLIEADQAAAVLRADWNIQDPFHRIAVTMIASLYYEAGDAQEQQQFATLFGELGQELILKPTSLSDEVADIQIKWLERVDSENIAVLPEEKVAACAMQMLLRKPDTMLKEYFHLIRLDSKDNQHPYVQSENELMFVRRRSVLDADIWLPEAIDYLRATSELDETTVAVLTTLDASLRSRTAANELLDPRLQETLLRRWELGWEEQDQGAPPDQITRLQLLTLIVHAGGDLPDTQPTDDQRLSEFKKLLDENDSILTQYKVLDPFKGLGSDHPVQTLVAAIGAERGSTNRGITAVEAAGYVTRFGRVSIPKAKLDPLVVLKVFQATAGRSDRQDRNIAVCFTEAKQEFGDPLKSLLELDTASSKLAERVLTDIRDSAIDPALFESADRFLPGQAKDRATFIEANPDSLLAMLQDYNADTRDDRENKFDPPVEDLTLTDVIDAMQNEVKNYRSRGQHNIADALEASAKQRRFVDGLKYMGGVTGTFYRSKEDGELTFKQYLPGVLYEHPGTTAQAVYLPDIELRYSRDGWSSSDWGDLHPILDGDWKLESVSKDGKRFEKTRFDEWRSNHPWWTSITIKNNQLLTLTGVDRTNKFWIELSYDDALPKIELKFDASSKDIDRNMYGVFMTNAAVDFTELIIVVDTDQVDSFRTEGTYATKMQFTRVPDKAEPDTASKVEVSEHSDADPANPRVKLSLKTESGKPATNIFVRLDQTGVKDQQPAWAEGTSQSDGIVLDRILPFGYYRMKIETPDGWRTTIKDIAVEFEKGLNATIVVPEPGLHAELKIDQLPDLASADRLGKLRFGTLRDYLTRNNLQAGGYSPVNTPEPEPTPETFADFPTVANGIEDIALRLHLQVTRELPRSSVNDGREEVTWTWTVKDVGDWGLLLTNSEVRSCESLESKSTTPVDGNPYFKMPSNVHRLGYLALELSEAKPYPYRFAIPAGQAKLMLVGIYGRPTEQVVQSIKMLPLEEDKHVWLATSLRSNSDWVRRIVSEPWFYTKDPGNYHGHLSRIEQTLADGDTLEVTFANETK